MSSKSPTIREERRERELALRRDDVIAAATNVFSEKGFQGAQVAEIANAAMAAGQDSFDAPKAWPWTSSTIYGSLMLATIGFKNSTSPKTIHNWFECGVRRATS